MYFNVGAGEYDSHGSETAKDRDWATNTMRGNAGNITPSGEDKTHVNDTELNRDRTNLYSSDDFGLINAFNWPNPSLKDARSWCGHSEHVSRLAMTPDGSRILSIGGEDKTLI